MTSTREAFLLSLDAAVEKQKRVAALQKEYEKSRLRRVLLTFREIGTPYWLSTLYRYAPWLPLGSITAKVFTGRELLLPFDDKRSHALNRFTVEIADCEIR